MTQLILSLPSTPLQRHWYGLAIAAAMLLCIVSPVIGQPPARPASPDRDRRPIVLTPEALGIHHRGFIFDGHNDLPWELRKLADPGFEKFDLRQPQPKLHTDIPRLRKGGVSAQFWSAYVPAETARTGEALRQTLEQIALILAMVRRFPDEIEMARTANDVERIQRTGKIASLIGIEGGHSIQNSLGTLRQLHELGAGYMTLTHSDTLDWADSATDVPRHGGLTDFGEEVVREMNRLGMLVDLSHVSADTMKDALRVTRAPVIFSHSSAYAIASHPRNVPDDVLALVRANGGIVMVNFFSGFIEPESAKARAEMFNVRRELSVKYSNPEEFQRHYSAWQRAHPIHRGTVHTLVDHIEHIARVAGVEHVGLGSDYDGITTTPEQLDDVSCYPYITQELLNRGYTEPQIHLIMSGNLLRVMRAVEKAAAEVK